jgi:hypothetical protein
MKERREEEDLRGGKRLSTEKVGVLATLPAQ